MQLGIKFTASTGLLTKNHSNKLLKYKAILKSICTYGIQLWGSEEERNNLDFFLFNKIIIMQEH